MTQVGSWGTVIVLCVCVCARARVCVCACLCVRACVLTGASVGFFSVLTRASVGFFSVSLERCTATPNSSPTTSISCTDRTQHTVRQPQWDTFQPSLLHYQVCIYIQHTQGSPVELSHSLHSTRRPPPVPRRGWPLVKPAACEGLG